MAFRPDDRFVWDYWIVRDGADYHLFFLNAPRSIGDPDLRHWNVSIGHAVSQDLVHWQELPTALSPSEGPAFDDYTTWTGSVIRRPDGRWMLFYTGTCRAENGLKQRIGAAVSDDLVTFTRLPENPLLDVDTRWYEVLEAGLWHDQAWRDPWIFRVPGDDLWHMAFTARGLEGPAFGRGVVGHATSPDLVSWTVQPPIAAPGLYGQMEVPQIFERGGRWYMLFCLAHEHMEPGYVATGRPGVVTGTHYLMADDPLGPWRLPEDRFLVGDPVGRLYAGRITEAPDGALVFMGFENLDAEGRFVGGLSDPLPVTILDDGRLRVDGRRYGIPLADDIA